MHPGKGSAAATVFWDVDTQADFMYPEGKLYVPGAEEIVPNLERLTQWAQQHRILLVSSACAHREGDAEFAVYGPHCLAGTPGQQKIPQTLAPRRLVIGNRPQAIPEELAGYDQVILEKDKVDVFTNPNIEALAAKLGPRPQVVLYGVVTEICVGYTARGLLDRGVQVRLVRDAVRHLDEAKMAALLREIESRGGRLITTEELLSSAPAQNP